MDRDKVIKGMEQFRSDIKPFCGGKADWERFDAGLTLLKEQEATMVIESENMYTGLPITHCPKCDKSLDRYLYGRQHEGEINFCPYCGRSVKWK